LKNVFLRKRQFALSEEPFFRLSVAREFVALKIRNQNTLLRRNPLEPRAIALAQLKRYAEAATNAQELDQLLGIEGNAARIFFTNLIGLVKTENA
jgi:CRISPR-associated protein Cas1